MKNIINDILNHLKTCTIARARLNSGNEDYGILANCSNFYNDLTNYEKKHFILSALSSPDGVPICDFLGGENPAIADMMKKGFSPENREALCTLYELTPKTISAILYRTLSNCLEQGKLFGEIENILNEEYNNLCP